MPSNHRTNRHSLLSQLKLIRICLENCVPHERARLEDGLDPYRDSGFWRTHWLNRLVAAHLARFPYQMVVLASAHKQALY